MFDVLLGTLLGVGLVLAFQELHRQYTAYNQRRWIRRSNEAIALLEKPDLTGWGYVEPTDAPVALPQESYCRSWCHDSQAEHDADLPWTDAQVKSASDDELVARIQQLAAQAERVWPGTKDTAW
jgi:hypothetical protein